MIRISIVSAFIVVALGLTFAAAGQADNEYLLQVTGTLKPDAQVFYPLTFKQGVPTYIAVTGNGHGDLDCYLLVKPDPKKPWRILWVDESPKDLCAMNGYINTDYPTKLWIKNNGTQVDNYSANVDQ